MAATVFLPYAIGKTNLFSDEEYNVLYDQAVVEGHHVIEWGEIVERNNSNTVIGSEIIEGEEEFSAFMIVEGHHVIEWDESRLFPDLASRIFGIAEIDTLEEIEHHPLYAVQFGSEIYSNGLDPLFESSEYAEYALFASLDTYGDMGNPKNLSITHRVGKKYRDKYVVSGIAWNDLYFIPGLQEEVFYATAKIQTATEVTGNKDDLGLVIDRALSVYPGNLLSSASIGNNLTVISPIAYVDNKIIYGGNTILASELLYNGRVIGTAQILTGNSFAPQVSEPLHPNLWKTSRTYSVDEYVEYHGYVYLSLQDSNTNQTPDAYPLYWQLVTRAVSAGPYYQVIGVGVPEIVNEPIIGFTPVIRPDGGSASSLEQGVEQYKPDFFGANLIFGSSQIENGPTGPTGSVIDIDGVTSTTMAIGFNVLHRMTGTPLGEASIRLGPNFNNDRTRYGGGGYPPGKYDVGSYWTPRGGEPDTSIGGGNYKRTLGGYCIGRGSIAQGALTIA
jgi:hypothetical protein